MKCDFAERISLLIDHELQADELIQVQNHLADCSDCQKMHEDFLFLKREIKEFSREDLRAAKLSSLRQNYLWSKKIRVPVPVFGALLLVIAAFALWTVIFGVRQTTTSFTVNAPAGGEKLFNENRALPKEKNETTISRFDRGGASGNLYCAKSNQIKRGISMKSYSLKSCFREIIILSLLLTAFAAAVGCSYFSDGNSHEAEHLLIQFQILTIEEKENERRVLSETSVEGLPGTDFVINLKTEKFKMQARFLNDLTNADSLSIRAKLNTRRFAGYSEKNLPLYEEDAQNHTFKVGFDKTVVLLPFGQNKEAGTLKIEITPKQNAFPNQSAKANEFPKINIVKPDFNGEINVEAFRIPHRFEIQAILLSDGREVARGTAKNLLEETQEFILQPNEKADPEILKAPLKIKLSVDSYRRSRPLDLVGISFDLRRESSESELLISNGAGIVALGNEVKYHLSGMPDGKKYELRFAVVLGEGEKAD